MNILCLKYFKKLSTTEANRHFIQIIRSYRHMFPSQPKKINVRIKGKLYHVQYDLKRRIYCGGTNGFRYEIRWMKGTTIEIEKNLDNVYFIRQ